MSNDKKVWVSLLTFDNVNIYGIGMSIPGIYDYPALMKLQDKMREKQILASSRCQLMRLGRRTKAWSKLIICDN